MSKKNKRLILKLNKKAYKALQKRAEAEGLNLSACIRKLIAEARVIDLPVESYEAMKMRLEECAARVKAIENIIVESKMVTIEQLDVIHEQFIKANEIVMEYIHELEELGAKGVLE